MVAFALNLHGVEQAIYKLKHVSVSTFIHTRIVLVILNAVVLNQSAMKETISLFKCLYCTCTALDSMPMQNYRFLSVTHVTPQQNVIFK